MRSIIILFALVTIKVIHSYRQSDYVIKHHRLELLSYYKPLVRNGNLTLFPYNRTTRTINLSFTLLEDLETAIPLDFQAYRFTSNEYRLFPLGLTVDFCKIQNKNTFGIIDVLQFSNLTNCPIVKGSYYVHNYRPDESKFPPHFHPGDYKLNVKVRYKTLTLGEANWYGSVISRGH